MPNSSENRTQNLPCTNTYTSHATAWSNPVAPGAMPEPSSCIGRVNHSTFIRKMPSSAKPRIASRARMRRGASIGANAPVPALIPLFPRALRASVRVPAVAVDVAVLDLFLAGLAHVHDLDVEVQVLAGHRVVEVDVDHAHAHLL